MTMVLYGVERSGHVHRVRALLDLLERPFELRETPHEARKTPEFLALNPLGEVPVLLDGDRVLADSNAILIYLCRRYDPADRWLPRGADPEAAIQRWLSIAAGELAFGLVRVRQAVIWNRPGIDLEAATAIGRRVLDLMERTLSQRPYLADLEPTIADLAMYAYTRGAPDTGIPLEPYPEIQCWHLALEQIPRFPRFPVRV